MFSNNIIKRCGYYFRKDLIKKPQHNIEVDNFIQKEIQKHMLNNPNIRLNLYVSGELKTIDKIISKTNFDNLECAFIQIGQIRFTRKNNYENGLYICLKKYREKQLENIYTFFEIIGASILIFTGYKFKK